MGRKLRGRERDKQSPAESRVLVRTAEIRCVHRYRYLLRLLLLLLLDASSLTDHHNPFLSKSPPLLPTTLVILHRGTSPFACCQHPTALTTPVCNSTVSPSREKFPSRPRQRPIRGEEVKLFSRPFVRQTSVLSLIRPSSASPSIVRSFSLRPRPLLHQSRRSEGLTHNKRCR